MNQIWNKQEREILAARKSVIAKEIIANTISSDSTILVFKVDEKQKYALPYEQIERVIARQEVVSVPHAAEIFLGLIYHNTEIWPVISCHRLLNFSGKESYDFFILCKKGKLRLALAIKEVLGQKILKKSEEIIDVKIDDFNFVNGIYKSDIAILDLEAIFNLLTPKRK